jgi:LysM repeat protein
MTQQNTRISMRYSLLAGAACLTLAGCSEPLDFDLRGLTGGFTTAEAAKAAIAPRPSPDDRGVISYPNYQVAVARRGDTIASVAERVGLEAGALARFNWIDPDKNEIIALPTRVAEPSPATGAASTGPIQPVDINTVAGGAIDRSPATPSVQTAALPEATSPAQTGNEPIRHKVERGETAFTVARLYSVPVKDLAEWNGLGADFGIRAGQFLLIPVASQNPPAAAAPAPEPVADVGQTTQPAPTGKLVRPVNGSIIREYSKGKNEGINIKAAPGTAVKAADTGTVAAITKSADGIPIVVVRHANNLLTVYANVTDVSVAKGDSIARGQSIAKLRDGDDSVLHFEVRNGFDSVDPNTFLN